MKKFLLLSLCALGLFSCKDEDSTTNTVIKGDTLVQKTLLDIVPDTTQAKFLYYSIDGDSVVPASKANTDLWDIKLAYLYGGGKTRQIDIFLNSGTVNTTGKTKGILADTTFDLLTTAPADEAFKADDTASARRIIPVSLDGKGMFVYNPSARTITPAPQKTLVLKTRNGNYAKLQIISIYKGRPATPDMMSEIGYYSFRYARSNSRKLATN
jgi:hypothetical protein